MILFFIEISLVIMSKNLIKEIENLKIKLRGEVNKKLEEFKEKFNIRPEQKFLELCFCILVANASIEITLPIWRKIFKNFLYLSKYQLAKELKKLGYRFYNKRASYIALARKFIKEIDSIARNKNDFEAREWLVNNIKGIGWKESSHFLRNIGYTNFAILDRHVLKVLKEREVINKIPKTLTKKIYLEIEEKLRNIAKSLTLNLAELDLYLFYLDTEKIPQKQSLIKKIN